MKKKNIGKLIKYIGNIIMLLAIVIIARKMGSYDVDYSMIFCKANIFCFLMVVVLYSVTVIFGGIPWNNLVNVFTGCKTPYSVAALVYTKSNIYKYIPGNVFQYVGRNELAVQRNLKHSDIALATLIDAGWNVFSMLLVAVLVAWKSLYAWLQQMYDSQSLFVVGIVLAIFIVIVSVFCIIKRQLIGKFVGKVFNLRVIGVLTKNFAFYMVQGLLNALLYVAVFSTLSGTIFSTQDILMCIGAILIAFVAGFVTPGAPGGVGIREAVSLFLLSSVLEETVILSGIIIMRVLSIVGDIFSFLVVWICVNFSQRRKRGVQDAGK